MTQKNTSQKLLFKTMFSSAGKLTAFVFISIVLLLAVRALTAPEIAKAEKQSLIDSFSQVLPKSLYNNDPLTNSFTLKDPILLKQLSSHQPVTFYRAYQNSEPVGVIFKTVAPNGYSGKISILMAVFADGRISGVRILKHKETPGLGDKIETNKSPWILSFNGHKLQPDNDKIWAVKKDGGQFDEFTGATITPRAVVKAVKNALVVVNDLGARLYE